MWLVAQGGYGEADVFQHSFAERKQGFSGINSRIATGPLYTAIPSELGFPDVVVAEGRRDLTGVQQRVEVADCEHEGGCGGGGFDLCFIVATGASFTLYRIVFDTQW
jgi:hypothetical protein